MLGKEELHNQEMIVVLDFGSQYNQLITRRIREFGVYSELHPHTVTLEEIKEMNPTGIIFSGGPNSVYGEDSFRCDERILTWTFRFSGSATACS